MREQRPGSTARHRDNGDRDEELDSPPQNGSELGEIEKEGYTSAQPSHWRDEVRRSEKKALSFMSGHPVAYGWQHGAAREAAKKRNRKEEHEWRGGENGAIPLRKDGFSKSRLKKNVQEVMCSSRLAPHGPHPPAAPTHRRTRRPGSPGSVTKLFVVRLYFSAE